MGYLYVISSIRTKKPNLTLFKKNGNAFVCMGVTVYRIVTTYFQSKCKCENFVQFINDVLFIYDRLSLIFFFSKVMCVSVLLADKGR